MPIYEYSCPQCGNRVEKIQRRALADIPCPECGEKAARSVSVFSAGESSSAGGCSVPPGAGFS